MICGNTRWRRFAGMAAFCLWLGWCSPAAQEPTGVVTLGKRKQLLWTPPNVEAPLPVRSGVAPCSLSAVLEQAGKRAVELTATLENFTAEEEIQYEKFEQSGLLEESDSSVFDYTFGFENRGGGRVSQEYRTPSKRGHAFPASSQDTGLAALALIFLPGMQLDYEMSCEGVDNWNGQPAFVIHFEQRKDKPARTLQFRSERGVYAVRLRGRAWISVDNAQVLHLETTSVHSIPAYKLQSNAIAIDYGPVQIRSRKMELWLPQSIEAFWEYQNYRIILVHTFTNFRLFSVDTEEKVKPPSEQRTTSGDKSNDTGGRVPLTDCSGARIPQRRNFKELQTAGPCRHSPAQRPADLPPSPACWARQECSILRPAGLNRDSGLMRSCSQPSPTERNSGRSHLVRQCFAGTAGEGRSSPCFSISITCANNRLASRPTRRTCMARGRTARRLIPSRKQSWAIAVSWR